MEGDSEDVPHWRAQNTAFFFQAYGASGFQEIYREKTRVSSFDCFEDASVK